MEEIPHLALKAAKKLNPKAQCWRWADGLSLRYLEAEANDRGLKHDLETQPF